MDETTQAIALRIRPLSDSSLIIHWLTQQHGRLSTVAKGARRAKSPFRGAIDLLFETEICFSKSRRSNLHALRETKLTNSHSSLHQDIKRLQLLAYATRLLEANTEPEHPLPKIYTIFSTLLTHLDTHPVRPALVYAFEIKLMSELGYTPPLIDDRLSKKSAKLMEQLSVLNWASITELKPMRSEAEKLSVFLEEFIQHNLEHALKGRSQLLTL
ncbi:MAG: DNA repair protein RecO [Verrucomicrobiota bacterium]|nr:DNA repair protein RecO [Verrucomicrobiota bacterium]